MPGLKKDASKTFQVSKISNLLNIPGRRRYLPYIFISLVLLVIAFILFMHDKPGTLKVDNYAFAVQDTASIAHIRFSNGKNSVSIDRSGEVWLIDEKFNANPYKVKALFRLLSSFEINSPVSNSIRELVLNHFKKESISVVIESSDKILKAYQITENNQIMAGSFMMLANDHEPYLMRVPGFNGRISMLFPCDDQFWRDNIIFKYSPADIVSVKVDYPGKPEASFIYVFNGFNDIEIKSTHGNKFMKIGKEIARAYLLNFTSVPYEYPLKWHVKETFDSLQHQKPYCYIEVKNTLNQLNILRTYRIPVRDKKGAFDLNRMYAVAQNDTIPVLVKYVDFDPIMKEYNDFSGQ